MKIFCQHNYKHGGYKIQEVFNLDSYLKGCFVVWEYYKKEGLEAPSKSIEIFMEE